MKTCLLILSSIALVLPTIAAPPLPAGMARADDPEEVAALYCEERQKQIEAIRKAHQAKLLRLQKEACNRHVQVMHEKLECLERKQDASGARSRNVSSDDDDDDCYRAGHARSSQPERRLTGAEAAHAHQRWINDEHVRKQRLLNELQK